MVVADDLARHIPLHSPLRSFALHPPPFFFRHSSVFLLRQSPPFVLLGSSSSLVFLLAFPLSASQHGQAFLSHTSFLLFPLFLAISQSLHPSPCLYLGQFACLPFQHRFFVHHQSSVGHKKSIEIIVLDCVNAWIVVRSHLNALQS